MATVDASIPLQVQLPRFNTPLEAQAQAATLRDQIAQTQLRQQSVQQGMQTLKDQSELSTIASDRLNIDPATGGFTPEALTKISNPLLRQKLNQERMGTMKTQAEIDYKTSEAGQEADKRKNTALHDMFETAYSTYEDVLKKTGNKDVATEAFNKSQTEGYNDIKATGRGGFPKDIQFKMLTPDDVGSRLISHKERMAEETARATAERGEQTPFIKETRYLDKLKGELADLKPNDPAARALVNQIAQIERHVAKLDAPSRTTVNMAGGPATVQGDALDLAANQLLIDGKMPAGFARNQANVGAIYKRAAELAKAKGQTAEAALFNSKSIKSDQVSLTNLTKQSDMITSFESTARKNLDMLVAQSAKVPRASWPIINKAIVKGELATGDPEAAKYMAIVKPFVDEYAKILSGQTGSAGASDTARREAAEIISPYFNENQIKQLAPFIRQELKNRTDSLSEQRDVIKARMSGHSVQETPKPAAPQSDQDKAAMTWAKAHPDDPRAKKIMEHTGG